MAIDYHKLCLGCMEERGAIDICPYCGWVEGCAPESALHLPPGTVLQGKYLLGRALGQGGFGITYIAWDNILKLKLAIKEYLPQQLAYRADTNTVVKIYKTSLAAEFSYGREKFLEEARTLARFNEHPNIVTVRDYFEANNTAYLVMNYHDGVALQSYLESKGGRLPFEQALAIFMPVLDALKEVHISGILHRDISLDNLLIDRKGRVILIDFGAARQAIGEKSKSLSVIMKAGYSPPEQYQSRGKQGPWTDIYAVAATMYRAMTGQPPLEAIDRMSEDELILPSQMGVKITNLHERALQKALAVKTEDRYQTVEEFQAELLKANNIHDSIETSDGVKARKPVVLMDVDVKQLEPAEEIEGGQNKTEKQVAKTTPLHADSSPAAEEAPTLLGDKEIKRYDADPNFNVKIFKYLATFTLVAILVVGAIILFEGRRGNTGRIDPAIINLLDADYYIDYENGTIPLSELPIGARVADPTWEWEFRLGIDYSDEDIDGNPTGTGEVRPVTWIIVAKDHYEGMDEHVTMISEELIGRFAFDNSIHHTAWGYNHWGESGTDETADRGLRPWLNSTGIHREEGFYRAFSDNFKRAVITSIVPNRKWDNGSIYNTEDRVFVPSTTELGDTEHNRTYPIGSAYSYFLGADNTARIAYLSKEISHYWLRSPSSQYSYNVRRVGIEGEFNYYLYSDCFKTAVRPVLNVAPDLLVSETVKTGP